MKIIPYGKQYIDYKDKLAVVSSLSNEYITTGPLVKKFEDRVNKYLGCLNSISVYHNICLLCPGPSTVYSCRNCSPVQGPGMSCQLSW